MKTALPGFTAEYGLYQSAATYRKSNASPGATITGAFDDAVEPSGLSNRMGYAGPPHPGRGGPSASTFPFICGGEICTGRDACCHGKCTYLGFDNNNCGACGNVCKNGMTCSQGCCVYAPPDAAVQFEGFFLSNFNYTLYNGCSPINDLKVVFQVTKEMSAPGGFSIQLNGFQNNPSSATTVADYLQYVVFVNGTELQGGIQYWNLEGYQNCYNQTQNADACLQYLLYNSLYQTIPGATTPLNTLPAGSTIEIDLSQSGGNITGATFTVNTGSGGPYSLVLPVPQANQQSFLAFEVNVVGYDDGAFGDFSPFGAGTLTYSIPSGQLTVAGTTVPNPTNLCTAAPQSGGTGETSNVFYGPMSQCSGSSISQTLMVPYTQILPFQRDRFG